MRRSISIFQRPAVAGVVCVREGVYPVGWRMGMHAHRFGQLLLVRGGRLCMEIVDTRVELAAGSVLAIPAGHEHAWEAVGQQPLTIFDISVESGFDEGRYWQALHYHGGSRAVLSAANAQAAMIAADALAAAIVQAQVGQDYRVRAQVYQYVAAVLAAIAAGEPERGDMVSRVETEMAVRYAEPLTLEQMAGWVGVGPKQLCRVFQRAGRESPMACVNSLRIHAACEALAQTDQPIHRIAERCGFADPRYFSRLLRSRLGCSPRRYRQEMVGE